MSEGELADLLAGADLTELGRRIRQARITKGLTQTELASGEVSTGYLSPASSPASADLIPVCCSGLLCG